MMTFGPLVRENGGEEGRGNNIGVRATRSSYVGEVAE
jgi:hypothetical protein